MCELFLAAFLGRFHRNFDDSITHFFLKMGVPPVIIHILLRFSTVNHLFWGTPNLWTSPDRNGGHLQVCMIHIDKLSKINAVHCLRGSHSSHSISGRSIPVPTLQLLRGDLEMRHFIIIPDLLHLYPNGFLFFLPQIEEEKIVRSPKIDHFPGRGSGPWVFWPFFHGKKWPLLHVAASLVKQPPSPVGQELPLAASASPATE